jgi:hypothetical protein
MRVHEYTLPADFPVAKVELQAPRVPKTPHTSVVHSHWKN